MATIAQEFEEGALKALAGAIAANPTVLENLIQTGEVDAQAVLANLFKNIPAAKGVSALIVGPLEAAAETAITAYVGQFIAAHTPAEVKGLIVTYLNGLAAKV